MLVRLPSGAKYSAQVEKEQLWLPKLAPLLPLPIPRSLALGMPSETSFPWHWSIYGWLEGKTASLGNISDLNLFATSLAEFLVAFHQIDATQGAPRRGTQLL
jgi:aminoglycoside phosphotransferase (APT) family kinase protein